MPQAALAVLKAVLIDLELSITADKALLKIQP